MRSQMFDLLSPQPFGRDRTCDVISFNAILFSQAGHDTIETNQTWTLSDSAFTGRD